MRIHNWVCSTCSTGRGAAWVGVGARSSSVGSPAPLPAQRRRVQRPPLVRQRVCGGERDGGPPQLLWPHRPRAQEAPGAHAQGGQGLGCGLCSVASLCYPAASLCPASAWSACPRWADRWCDKQRRTRAAAMLRQVSLCLTSARQAPGAHGQGGGSCGALLLDSPHRTSIPLHPTATAAGA